MVFNATCKTDVRKVHLSWYEQYGKVRSGGNPLFTLLYHLKMTYISPVFHISNVKIKILLILQITLSFDVETVLPL